MLSALLNKTLISFLPCQNSILSAHQVIESVSGLINQWINQSVDWSISGLINQWIGQSVDWSISRLVG